jgi:ribosomal protein L10
MNELDGVTVEELSAIRNAFDKNHRIVAFKNQIAHGGKALKDIPIEFDPLMSVEACLGATIREVYNGAVAVAKLVKVITDTILDKANAAIMLLDWAGLHQFVLIQFDALINQKKVKVGA